MQKDLVRSPEKHYSEEFRTIEQVWQDHYRDDPTVAVLHHKIASIARLPKENYAENLQFLKYEPGEWYKKHHDYFHDSLPNPSFNLRHFLFNRIEKLASMDILETSFSNDILDAINKIKLAVDNISAKQKTFKILFFAYSDISR